MASEYLDERFLSELRGISGRVERTPLGPFKRNWVQRAEMHCNGGLVDVAVKAFRPQGILGSFLARTRGSKAARAWEVASALHRNGVGTPRPIAFLERWEGKRLAESYFLTVYERGLTSFHRELVRLYREDPQFHKILVLMEAVARAVRAMHDAGVFHGDLGNQNICLRRKGEAEWGDVQFIDLNRGRVRDEVSFKERAFDLSRLTLPSKLQRIFRHMYFRERYLRGERPPNEFIALELSFRRRFAFHTWTRRFRHPIRWYRKQKQKAREGKPTYPPARELWIWDEPTGQPVRTMRKRERMLHVAPLSVARIVWEAVLAAPRTSLRFLRLKRGAYRSEVCLENRVGMTVTLSADTAERERALLEKLGRLPLLVRYYHHESPAKWDVISGHLRGLHEAGYPVSVALVQDAHAVRDPASWTRFVTHVLDAVGDIAQWAEIGHATNRVKWGIWNLGDYRRLLRPFRELRPRYPGVRFMGPAVNDFETHYVAAKLGAMPRGVRLDGLSLHLYVDRRGAPENRQYGFSALEKFILAKALAETSRRCGSEVIISEVNWFLKWDAAYSSAFAPFEHPWRTKRGTTVTEDVYADYMIRYYLHAICSGMVDRVYWWRLVAGYFGLVNDIDPAHWVARPAFEALRVFLALLGRATFVRKLEAPEGVHLLRFRRPEGDEALVAYCSDGAERWTVPFDYQRKVSLVGEELPDRAREIELSGRPVYLLGIDASSSR